MPEHWLSFVYQYVVGGFFFFFIIFAAIRTKVLVLQSKEGKRTFIMLIGGFLYFFIGHALWIYFVTK